MRRAIVLAAVVALALVSLAAAKALPPGGTFNDDDGNVHEGNIEAVAAEGITEAATHPPTIATAPARW